MTELDQLAASLPDGPCRVCDGNGLVECPDPFACLRGHYDGWCECRECGGTGEA